MKIFSLVIFYLTVNSIALFADDHQPKCHVYLPTSGWTSNVRESIRTQYNSVNVCKTILSAYPCYAYYESKEGCTTNDTSLVNQFIKNATRDGFIVP